MKAIVLAAGLSRRMKSQKLLLPFGGATMIEATLEAVASAGFGEIILVASRVVADAAAEFVRSRENLSVVVNEAPEEGQSSSLRLGVVSLGEPCCFCVALGDMPLVTAEQFAAYRNFFERSRGEKTALVPKRGDEIGHPAFFSMIWAERFLSAEGDAGGRRFIRKFADEVLWTDGEESFFRDVDTPDDYAALGVPGGAGAVRRKCGR